jgi:hypothetical protein
MEVHTAPPGLSELFRALTQGPLPEKDLSPTQLAEALARGLVRRG